MDYNINRTEQLWINDEDLCSVIPPEPNRIVLVAIIGFIINFIIKKLFQVA